MHSQARCACSLDADGLILLYRSGARCSTLDMDPYSHAYPSSHRRSTSKIGIPKKPRSALESVQSEPFVLLVASAVVSSCALIAVDAWALKRGMHAVVLTAASMLCGAAWGAARGHLRLELLPTAVRPFHARGTLWAPA